MIRRLKARGLRIETQRRTVLTVAGRRVRVLAARQGLHHHPVRAHGQRYEYSYPRTIWSCHQHGKRITPPPDMWAFLDLTDGALFIVPGPVVHGLTVSRHIGDESRDAALLQYRNRYDLLVPAKERAA